MKKLPEPDGSSAEADTLVWFCFTCDDAKAYSQGDITKERPKCKNGHKMHLVPRTDFV